MDNPRPNAVATVSACTDTSVTLTMIANTSSVMTIDVIPMRDGQEGGDETAEDDHQHGEQDGQRDALADDEIVTDPVLDLYRHAEGAACTHVDRRVVGRQLVDDPDRRLCGLVKGPAHVHEDETGAPVPTAQIGCGFSG